MDGGEFLQPPVLVTTALALVGLPMLVHMVRVRGREVDPLPAGDPPAEPAGLAAFVLALFVSAVVAQVMFSWGLASTATAPAPVERQLLLAAVRNGFIVAAVWGALRLARGPTRAAAPAGRSLAGGLLGALAFLPVAFVTGVLVGWLFRSMEMTQPPQDLVRAAQEGDWSTYLAVSAFAILAAPPAEEFLFRGALYGGLRWLARPEAWPGTGGRAPSWGRALGGPLPATVLSAATFSLIHLEKDNPAALPVTFLLGLFLAAAAERTGGLVAPIALHAGYNSAQVLAMLAGRLNH